jgi:hypothetical protein
VVDVDDYHLAIIRSDPKVKMVEFDQKVNHFKDFIVPLSEEEEKFRINLWEEWKEVNDYLKRLTIEREME